MAVNQEETTLNSWFEQNVVWVPDGCLTLHKLPNQDPRNLEICQLHAIDWKILLEDFYFQVLF